MTFKIRECILHLVLFFVLFHFALFGPPQISCSHLRQQRHQVIFVVGIVLVLLRSENIAVRLLRSAYLGHIL
jgi:hypothetical protein